MKQQVLRIGTIIVSVASALATGIAAVAGGLPQNYHAVAYVGAAVLALVIAGVKAFDAELAAQSLTLQREQSGITKPAGPSATDVNSELP